MFNLGIGEIIFICVILIIVVGPDKLPTLMKTVGKSLRTLRQASRDIRTTVGLDELMREDVLRTPPRPAPRPLPGPAQDPEPTDDQKRQMEEAVAVSQAEGDPGPIAREDPAAPAAAARELPPPPAAAAAATPPKPAPAAAPPPPAAGDGPAPVPGAPAAGTEGEGNG